MAGDPTPPGASPHAFGVAGLLGRPVARSRSPAIRDFWLRAVAKARSSAAVNGSGLLLDEARPASCACSGATPSIEPEPVRAIEAAF